MAQSPQPNRLRSKLSTNLMLDRVEHNLATVGNGIRSTRNVPLWTALDMPLSHTYQVTFSTFPCSGRTRRGDFGRSDSPWDDSDAFDERDEKSSDSKECRELHGDRVGRKKVSKI
jgi:hypothetical protein